MSMSRNVSKLSSYFQPRIAARFHGVAWKNQLLYASFCTSQDQLCVTEISDVVESPGAPDGDLVLPKIAKWAESRKLNGDLSNLVTHVPAEIVDDNLDKVYNVLNGKLNSINAVNHMLSECDRIRLSDSLVEKVLLKYRRNWVRAFGFFSWAKQQKKYIPTAKCYDMTVDILGRSRNFELMWELVQEMNNVGELVSFTTMTKVMKRLAKFRKYEEAVEAFDTFEIFGLTRKTASMNMLMDLLVKERNVERAQKVYLDYKDQIQPNDDTFNILIHGFCKANKYSQAKKVLKDMETHGFQPDVISHTLFIEYYCRENKFRKVDRILDEMLKKGCPPSAMTYTIVVRALGEADKIDEAVETYHKMKQNGCVPDASFCSTLIYALSKSGRFNDACDIFEEMPKAVIDVSTYNSMIAAACTHSREEYALELLEEMEEKSFKPNINTYAPLLKLCCEKKRMTVLNYVLADMFQKNVSLDFSIHCLLVDLLCKSEELEHTCAFFEQMVLKGMVPRSKTYEMLIEKLDQKAARKAKRQIKKLMSRAEESSGHLNDQTRSKEKLMIQNRIKASGSKSQNR